MIACNGWLDVLLYASTRADIVFSEFPPNEETGIATFGSMWRGNVDGGRLGNVTVIEGGEGRPCRFRKRSGSRSGESGDGLYGVQMGGIGVKENVEVTVESIEEGGSRMGLQRIDSDNWDGKSSRSRAGKSFEDGNGGR